MELIKELPEVFEEFAEQRQKSFMAMKGLKDQGVPVVGAYCTYFPAEIARAMGAVTVGLCSVSDETIPDAEKDLPKNLCPLIKSSYGFAKTDKCPFFYFSDVVVGETTCDGKKKMYEYMSDFKDVFVMELPNTQSEMALQLWKSELIRFKKYLEKKFDVEITDEAVLEAVELLVNKKHYDEFVMISADPSVLSTRMERTKGFEDALILKGIHSKTNIVPADIDEEGLRKIIEKELRFGVKTLIFVANCFLLPRVFVALKNYRNLMPDTLGLLGYDNTEWANLSAPTVTTIVQPAYKEGCQSAKILIDAIEERYEECPNQILKCYINWNESVIIGK